MIKPTWMRQEKPKRKFVEHVCRKCKRKGKTGFWHSTDPGLEGWYCTNTEACQTKTNKKLAEQMHLKQVG